MLNVTYLVIVFPARVLRRASEGCVLFARCSKQVKINSPPPPSRLLLLLLLFLSLDGWCALTFAGLMSCILGYSQLSMLDLNILNGYARGQNLSHTDISLFVPQQNGAHPKQHLANSQEISGKECGRN